MNRELYFVVGIQTNYRTLLKSAIDVGNQYEFVVKIIDLNGLVEKWKSFRNDWKALGLSDSIIHIDNLQELKQFSNGQLNREAIIVFLYPPVGELKKAWKCLQKTCPQIGFMSISPMPSTTSTKNTNTIFPVKWLKAALRKVISIYKPVPSFWVVSGTECINMYKTYFRTITTTQFILAHSIEFEYLKYGHCGENLNESYKNNPYALVLDQGWFSKPKPDFLTDNQYPPAPRKKFRKEMSNLLSRISANTGLEIIISCHPKASLKDTKQFYKGHTVLDSPTAQLMKSCEIAIANTSTSIHYAILENKPLILFTSDELSDSIVHPMETAICHELGIEYINLSQNSGVIANTLGKRRSTSIYRSFHRRYIRQDKALQQPLWNIVFSSLNSLPCKL